MYSQDNLVSDFQRGGGQNIDPIPISELILGVGGNSKRESPDFESPEAAISANDG